MSAANFSTPSELLDAAQDHPHPVLPHLIPAPQPLPLNHHPGDLPQAVPMDFTSPLHEASVGVLPVTTARLVVWNLLLWKMLKRYEKNKYSNLGVGIPTFYISNKSTLFIFFFFQVGIAKRLVSSLPYFWTGGQKSGTNPTVNWPNGARSVPEWSNTGG